MKQSIEKALESLQKKLEQHTNLELDMLQPRLENTREGICSWSWLSQAPTREAVNQLSGKW